MGIHLIPSTSGRIWDSKDTKDIKILGMDDKRQITCVVSYSAVGELLPAQVIFIGITKQNLPKHSEGKDKCLVVEWHFTFSRNHWSTLQTSKQFVEEILQPYLASKITTLHNLLKYQKLVWLIDS